ncbi:hypothetical protein [Cognatiluteimonas telluris]|jgi:hypothetical protein|uniref:hypothetical protein n=1 Tax=Cognatiluteimonas telluris TaxID=1104775 RepID=UPI00140E3F1C|nr:hypothetical protein [Lysobacter telluris]
MKTNRGRVLQRILSACAIAVGVVLMAGKIHADGEPGAIPLLLVVLGTAWHVGGRWRGRSRRPSQPVPAAQRPSGGDDR